MTTNLRRGVPALLVAVVSVAGALLVAAWRDSLPEPVATHWGSGPGPNGFTSIGGVIASVLIAGAVGFAVCLLAFVPKLDATARRALAAIACGTAVFVVVLMVTLTASQRGLADAAGASMHWWTLLAGAIAGICAAAIAAFAMPGGAAGPAPTVVGVVPTEKTGRTEWSGRATFGLPVYLLAAGLGVVLAIVAVLLGTWIPLVVTAAILVVVFAVTGLVRVRVDPQQVAITATLGWPRALIPLDDVARAEVVDVRALRDFGGWGYRIGISQHLRGAVGFVVRSGEALVVVRTAEAAQPNRRDVVVVGDARVAAAVINSQRPQGNR